VARLRIIRLERFLKVSAIASKTLEVIERHWMTEE